MTQKKVQIIFRNKNFSKSARYKKTSYKSHIAFLYTSKRQLENENLRTCHLQ